MSALLNCCFVERATKMHPYKGNLNSKSGLSLCTMVECKVFRHFQLHIQFGRSIGSKIVSTSLQVRILKIVISSFRIIAEMRKL